MGPPLARKTRISPIVEALEDRRLLSSAGPAPGWDDPSFGMPDHAELAPPVRGSMLGLGNSAGSRGPGSPVDGNSAPDTQAILADRPDSALVEPHDPSALSMPAPQGADHPGSGWPADGQDSTGSVPVSATPLTSLTPSSPTGYAEPIEAPDSVASRAPEGDPLTAGATFVIPPEASARAASPGPTARLVAGFVTTSHVETDPSAHPETTEAPTADGSPLALIGMLPSEPAIAPGNSPRGSSTTGLVNGPGSLPAPGRPALDVGPSKGAPEARSPEEAPGTPIEEAEGTGGRASAGELARIGIAEAIETPDPRLADMIMSLLPVDRSTIDGIVDRFLDPLEGLSSSVTGLNGPMGLLAGSLTLAVTVLAAEMSLRMRRSREDEDEGPDGFPGLPGLARGSIS